MKAKQTSYGWLLVIGEGEPIVKGIAEWCGKQNIFSGAFFAIGAARGITLAYYSTGKKEYIEKRVEEQCEILSLAGNIALENNSPIIHAHISLATKDFSVIGGHFVEGTAGPMVEVHILRDEGTVKRVLDKETNLRRLML